MAAPRKHRVLLGHIVCAHGVRGEVLIKSYTSAPEDIASYGPLTDETSDRALAITLVRVTAKGVVARLDNVTDRTAADMLKGLRLYVERDQLPETGSSEFYHADLIGLTAVSPEGATIGRLVALQNYGAGDLLEIQLESSRETKLVPFTSAFVPEVDVASGRVVIAMPSASEEVNERDRRQPRPAHLSAGAAARPKGPPPLAQTAVSGPAVDRPARARTRAPTAAAPSRSRRGD
jgi:16S rRNA processing protein RimM